VPRPTCAKISLRLTNLVSWLVKTVFFTVRSCSDFRRSMMIST